MKNWISERLRSAIADLYCAAAAAVVAACCSPALAVVTIFDGFGDADLNNNGVPFEVVDTNVQGSLSDTTWIPGRLSASTLLGDFNDDQSVDAADYTVWRDNLDDPSDAVINNAGDGVDGVTTADYSVWRSNYGSVGAVNTEITAPAIDPSDTGIRWFQMRGFTGASPSSHPGSGASKPTIRIVDDSIGAQLETKPVTETGGLGRAAIDSGYAMSWESRGGGSSAAGFFDQTISLGQNVGDEVKVSFDFRHWADTPNAEEVGPDYSELRFGLFQDTDDQIGQINPFAGRQVDEEGEPTSELKPARWGFDEGLFNGRLADQPGTDDDLIGSKGDAGWTAAVWVGDNIPAGSQDITFENGGGARIREEVQADNILEGSDVEFVARAPNLNPDEFGKPLYDFVDMDPEKVYTISLSLMRATETVEGDAILATLTVVDKATAEVFSFDGLEQDFQSDSWDYFAMRNATSGANEIDFLIDNFMVEVIAAGEGTTGALAAPEPAACLLLGFLGAGVASGGGRGQLRRALGQRQRR